MRAEATTDLPAAARIRVLLPLTNLLLIAFISLTAVASVILYGLPGDTRTLFAWTIEPPLTAAFLGGGYAAGFVLVTMAVRSRGWAYARLPLITITVFAALTLLATLSHTERFHFSAPGLPARFAAWVWLVVYVVVPCGLLVAVVRQHRAGGSDPDRGRSWPPVLALILGGQGALMGAAGIALFVAPAWSASRWPWALTPLTAQMIGSWLIAFGAAAVVALANLDGARLRIGSAGYAVFGSLQLIALARFGAEVRWGSAGTAVYLALMVSVVFVGIVGYLFAVRTDRPGG